MTNASDAMPNATPPPPGDFKAGVERMIYAIEQQHARAGEKDRARVIQDIRRDLEPDPEDPRATERICKECGRSFWRWKGARHVTCRVCSANRLRRNVEDLRTRSGPGWEKTVRKALAYWQGELERLEATRADQAAG